MEFDEIIVKESPGLCRCCLSEGCYKDMGTEYAWMNENEVYADMLLECFDISISQLNDGPNGPNRLICEVCITRLRDACYFKKQVLESEKKFIDMVGRGEFKSKAILVSLANMKAETADDDDAASFGTDDADPEYLDDEIEYLEEDILKAETQEPGVSDVTADPLPVRGKRGRPRKDPVKADKKKVKTEPKPKSSKPVLKDENEAINAHKANRIKRRNLEILLNNTTVIPFKWRRKYICFFCGLDIEKYDHFKEHTMTHKQKQCTIKDWAIKGVKGKQTELKFDVSGGITCRQCDELFPDLESVRFHLSTKHKLQYNKKHEFEMRGYRLADCKCTICEVKFDSFYKLIKHTNDSHAAETFICDDCGQSFSKKRDLQSHIRYYHRSEYFCRQCDLKFTSKAAFSKHNARPHHIICEICFEEFTSNLKRRNHILRNHFKNNDFKCGFCKKKFVSKISVMQHFGLCKAKEEYCRKKFKKSASLDLGNRKQVCARARDNFISVFNMTTIVPFKYYKNKFKCFFCNIECLDCDDLRNHVSQQHSTCVDEDVKRIRHTEEHHIKVDISSLSCKVCHESMPDIDTLTTHIIDEHKCEYDKSFNSKFQLFKLINNKFPCLDCGKTFKEFYELFRHHSADHSEDVTVCMYCGKSFKSLLSMKAHIHSRHNPEGYKCSICKLEFTTTYLLGGHMAKVHDKKKVKCKVCTETFSTPYVMKNHMVKAHGKGFKCQHCGKLLATKFFMDRHIRRAHFNEKNAECSVCFERFFDKRLLKIHMVKHTGVRNFSCDICDKAFLWRKNLTSHMKSHTKK